MEHPATPEQLRTFWRHQVDACQASGLSGVQYCKANNLVYHRFVYWRQKFEPARHRQPRPSDTGGFASVRMDPVSHCELSLSLPNGLTICGISAANVSVVRQLLDQF